MSTPALSIRQPWAELILRGEKCVEIRSWHTHYRGRLWLHVGTKMDSGTAALYGLCDLYRGGYVGAVSLAGVLQLDRKRWQQWENWHLVRPYQRDRHGWLLADVVRFEEPIDAPGRLGLFRPADEHVAALEAAFVAAAPHKPGRDAAV